MGLLNIFKKKKRNEETALTPINNNEIIPRSKLILHDDLKGLVWIGDGKLKNYTQEILNQNSFEIDGFRITLSAMQQEEPSLIYTKQKINEPKDLNSIERPSYYPTYSDLTPEQKWVYLSLLTNPYNADIDIGYVFILYYGLERHLLQGEFEKALRIILKLRDVHENKSFQTYSANALVLTSMLHQKGDLALEFIQSIDKEHELAFSDNLFLICYYSFELPLLPKDIMRMAKSFEFTNTNYIKKYSDLFLDCLTEKIKEKLGTEKIVLKKYITKTELNKIKQQEISIFANVSIIEKTIPVPQLTDSFKIKKEIHTFLEDAHETVKIRLKEMRKAGKEIPENKPKTIRKKKVIVFDEEQEKALLSELELNKNDPIARHDCYNNLQNFYYKIRTLDEKYVDKFIEYSFLDIDCLSEFKTAYINFQIAEAKKRAKYLDQEKKYLDWEINRIKEQWFMGYIHFNFKGLSVILEKRGSFKRQ